MNVADVGIRLARDEDLTVMQDIERAAGVQFAEIGMDFIADDEPPTLDELHAFQRAGRAWVYADHSDHAVAYLLAMVVDGAAHLEQVSVHPRRARAGIGRALIDHLVSWCRDAGLPAVTLTTYADVPWNGPYYLRCGFRELAEGELTPGLHEIRAEEQAKGLDFRPRICMRLAVRDLNQGAASGGGEGAPILAG